MKTPGTACARGAAPNKAANATSPANRFATEMNDMRTPCAWWRPCCLRAAPFCPSGRSRPMVLPERHAAMPKIRQSAAQASTAPVAQHLARGVVSRHARDPAAGMRARTAQVHALHRHPVVAVPQHGARAEELVEGELA